VAPRRASACFPVASGAGPASGPAGWSGTRRKRGEAAGRATATAAGEPTGCTPRAGREGIIPRGDGWIIGRARSATLVSGIASRDRGARIAATRTRAAAIEAQGTS
jgi:hypothetical protein